MGDLVPITVTKEQRKHMRIRRAELGYTYQEYIEFLFKLERSDKESDLKEIPLENEEHD